VRLHGLVDCRATRRSASWQAAERREPIGERKFSEEVRKREPAVTKKRIGTGAFL
jgi:G:T/U-mismatch repair DNA glycosylase